MELPVTPPLLCCTFDERATCCQPSPGPCQPGPAPPPPQTYPVKFLGLGEPPCMRQRRPGWRRLACGCLLAWWGIAFVYFHSNQGLKPTEAAALLTSQLPLALDGDAIIPLSTFRLLPESSPGPLLQEPATHLSLHCQAFSSVGAILLTHPFAVGRRQKTLVSGRCVGILARPM
jgi:hypothetical protein